MQLGSDSASWRLGFTGNVLELIKLKVLLLAAFQQVNLNRVVPTEKIPVKIKALNLLVHEKPAASVHESARLRLRFVTITTLDHTVHVHLTWREQVDSGNRFVADG